MSAFFLVNLDGVDLDQSGPIMSPLTGLGTLQPWEDLGAVEVETTHLDEAAVDPTIGAVSLGQSPHLLTVDESRQERENREIIF